MTRKTIILYSVQRHLSEEEVQYIKKLIPVVDSASNEKAKDNARKAIIEALLNHGYDGCYYENTFEGLKNSDDHIAWIAFEPQQIKSATGNNGDFSNSPDITKESLKENKILDELQMLLETVVTDGVADKYAEKTFNIEDPNKSMNQRAVAGIPKDDSMGEFVGEIFNGGKQQSNLFVNPRSLKNFEPEVRAISNKDNQLFVAQYNGKFLHFQMGVTIKKNGRYDIADGAYDEEHNITWVRVKGSNTFGYGESMDSFVSKNAFNIEDVNNRTAELQKHHPQFKFVTQLYWDIKPENVMNEKNITDGVADKYGEKEFNIPDQSKQQNLTAMQGLLGKPFVVYNLRKSTGNKQVPIYKNPPTLDGFDADVRAIATRSGDLFVLFVDEDIMHGQMGSRMGLVDTYHSGDNVLLHRVGNTNEFGLGDSGVSDVRTNADRWKNTVKILRTTKGRNPGFDFYPLYYQKIKRIEAPAISADGNDEYENPLDMYGEPMYENKILDELQTLLETVVINEGVADKAAERMFNIPDPNTIMNQKAMAGIKPQAVSPMGTFVGSFIASYSQNIEVPIYLNPRSLKDFDADVKAVSNTKGDLFVAQINSDFYHSDLASAVNDGGVYRDALYNAYDEEENVTWHRIGSTDDFGWSTSYKDFGSRPQNFPKVIEMHKAVKEKNPKFEFYRRYWEEIRLQRYDDENNINNDSLLNYESKQPVVDIIKEELRGLETNLVEVKTTDNYGLKFPDDYVKMLSRVQHIYHMGAMRPVGKNDEWWKSKTIQGKYRGVPVFMNHMLNADKTPRGWSIVKVGFPDYLLYTASKQVPQPKEVKQVVDKFYEDFNTYMQDIPLEKFLQKYFQDVEAKTGKKVSIYDSNLYDTATKWLSSRIFNRVEKAKVLKQLMNEGLSVEDAIRFFSEIK